MADKTVDNKPTGDNGKAPAGAILRLPASKDASPFAFNPLQEMLMTPDGRFFLGALQISDQEAQALVQGHKSVDAFLKEQEGSKTYISGHPVTAQLARDVMKNTKLDFAHATVSTIEPGGDLKKHDYWRDVKGYGTEAAAIFAKPKGQLKLEDLEKMPLFWKAVQTIIPDELASLRKDPAFMERLGKTMSPAQIENMFGKQSRIDRAIDDTRLHTTGFIGAGLATYDRVASSDTQEQKLARQFVRDAYGWTDWTAGSVAFTLVENTAEAATGGALFKGLLRAAGIAGAGAEAAGAGLKAAGTAAKTGITEAFAAAAESAGAQIGGAAIKTAATEAKSAGAKLIINSVTGEVHSIVETTAAKTLVANVAPTVTEATLGQAARAAGAKFVVEGAKTGAKIAATTVPRAATTNVLTQVNEMETVTFDGQTYQQRAEFDLGETIKQTATESAFAGLMFGVGGGAFKTAFAAEGRAFAGLFAKEAGALTSGLYNDAKDGMIMAQYHLQGVGRAARSIGSAIDNTVIEYGLRKPINFAVDAFDRVMPEPAALGLRANYSMNFGINPFQFTRNRGVAPSGWSSTIIPDLKPPEKTWIHTFFRNPYYRARSRMPGQDDPSRYLPNYLSGGAWIRPIFESHDNAAQNRGLIAPITQVQQNLVAIVRELRSGAIDTATAATRAKAEIQTFASAHSANLTAFADDLTNIRDELERYANTPAYPKITNPKDWRFGKSQIVGDGMYGASGGVSPTNNMDTPAELTKHFGIDAREYSSLQERFSDRITAIRSLTDGSFFNQYLAPLKGQPPGSLPVAPGFNDKDSLSHFILEDFSKIAVIGVDGGARLRNRTADKLVTESLDWRHPSTTLNLMNWARMRFGGGWGKRDTPIQFLRLEEVETRQGYYNEHRRFPVKGKQLWEGPEKSKNVERNAFMLSRYSETNRAQNDGKLNYGPLKDYMNIKNFAEEIYNMRQDAQALRALENLRDYTGDYGDNTLPPRIEYMVTALTNAETQNDFHRAKFWRTALDVKARESTATYSDRYMRELVVKGYRWFYDMRQFPFTSEISTPFKDRWVKNTVENFAAKWRAGLIGAPTTPRISPTGDEIGLVKIDKGAHRWFTLQPALTSEQSKKLNFMDRPLPLVGRAPGLVHLATGGLFTRRGVVVYGLTGALGFGATAAVNTGNRALGAIGLTSGENVRENTLANNPAYKLLTLNTIIGQTVEGGLQGIVTGGIDGYKSGNGVVNSGFLTGGGKGLLIGAKDGVLGAYDTIVGIPRIGDPSTTFVPFFGYVGSGSMPSFGGGTIAPSTTAGTTTPPAAPGTAAPAAPAAPSGTAPLTPPATPPVTPPSGTVPAAPATPSPAPPSGIAPSGTVNPGRRHVLALPADQGFDPMPGILSHGFGNAASGQGVTMPTFGTVASASGLKADFGKALTATADNGENITQVAENTLTLEQEMLLSKDDINKVPTSVAVADQRNNDLNGKTPAPEART